MKRIALFETTYKVQVSKQQELVTFKHVFSHLTWHVSSYYIQSEPSHSGQWFTREQIELLPMPVPMLKIWHTIK